jgi:hypothetical protein
MNRFVYSALTLLLCIGATDAGANEFAAQVMPPRFETTAKPGTVFREVIEINNESARPSTYSVATADWVMGADGNPAFSQELAADSCRPWVGIESSKIQLAGSGRKRFRFEVAVPADAPAGECRFAILIEGEPQRTDTGLMVTGRIGVIVYVTIGDATAQLTVVGTKVATVQGRSLPAISVRNAGNAHGRLGGFIDGLDASGAKLVFAPSGGPILPGATVDVVLSPVIEGNAPAPVVQFPISFDGQLDWGTERMPLKATIAR